MTKYRAYCVAGPEQHVPPITPDMVVSALRGAAPTAAGLDAWAPRELKWVEGEAATLLAKLLAAIEDGHPWPEQLRRAR
eukprot:13587398-Alexandrium_andersonii.AAC.1